MVAGKELVSFDDIIQADRLRRKNEALANEIFGKGRRLSTSNNGNNNLHSRSRLASRAGVAKSSQRSVSSASQSKQPIEASRSHVLHEGNYSSNLRIPQRENPVSRLTRNNRIYEAAVSNPFHKGSSNQPVNDEMGGISIRGLAGPYVVIGKNFAPGTTAADIESAMMPSGGEMQSCKIVAFTPILIAEMVFTEKANAENVITTFNNKKADGRILHVYMKTDDKSAAATSPALQMPIEPRAARVDLTRPDVVHHESIRPEPIRLEPIRPETVHPEPANSEPVRSEPSYDSQREQSDRNRRRADPEFQDGSFGFEQRGERMDLDADDHQDIWRKKQRESERLREGERGRGDRRLYSDDLYRRHRGAGFR